MSAVGFQLTTTLDTLVLQDSPNGTHTPANPQQAQGAPVPQDTVTLTPQTARGRDNNNPPNQLNFAPKALLAALRRNAQDPGVPAIAQGAEQTQQQELQQLDQALQQLGIDPQSISLFNQLALLAFANDPAALQQFVHQLQQSAQQLLDQGVAAPNANPVQRDTQPVATSAQTTTVGQVRATVPLDLAQATVPGSLASTIPAAAQASPMAPNTATQGNVPSATFQELQITVAVLEGQPPPAPPNFSQPAPLNVTA